MAPAANSYFYFLRQTTTHLPENGGNFVHTATKANGQTVRIKATCLPSVHAAFPKSLASRDEAFISSSQIKGIKEDVRIFY